MARVLIILGIILILVGAFLTIIEKTSVFKKVPLGKLPGDIVFKKGTINFYFPITTCVLISIIFTLIFWVLRK
ncbi:MAG: DUF2905 domain-containing protein [bacterium]|nr:DUF2905 domain-containing protein [bacterium]